MTHDPTLSQQPQHQAAQAELQRATQRAAARYGFNLGQLGGFFQVLLNHPEFLQLINLVASLRGNPNLIGQVQAGASKTLLSALIALNGVVEYIANAENAAGVAPTPLFSDIQAALNTILANASQAGAAGAAGMDQP